MDPNKLKAGLISGPVVGLIAGLIAVVPILNNLNCCCCPIGSLLGGLGAAALLNNSLNGRGITPMDGLTVGAISGGVAGLLYAIIAIIGSLIWGAVSIAAVPEQVKSGLPPALIGLLSGVMFSIVGALVVAVLSTAGGALGGALFKGPGGMGTPPPPPPPNPGNPYGQPYGQQPGGPYGGHSF
jgi:hypothetical protein